MVMSYKEIESIAWQVLTFKLAPHPKFEWPPSPCTHSICIIGHLIDRVDHDFLAISKMGGGLHWGLISRYCIVSIEDKDSADFTIGEVIDLHKRISKYDYDYSEYCPCVYGGWHIFAQPGMIYNPYIGEYRWL